MREDSRPSLPGRVRARRLTVAIDGPAGAGKTTIGRELGRRLRVPVVDTGLMYRAVARELLDRKLAPEDPSGAQRLAADLTFALAGDDDEASLTADGGVLTETGLHTAGIDRTVPIIAADPLVRTVLVAAQRALAADRAVIMLGRDIGTVVLPRAPVKLFVTADLETRAERRRLERPEKNPRLVEDLRKRDRIDTTRLVSPLRPAPDALTIDTTYETVEQSVGRALVVVQKALA